MTKEVPKTSIWYRVSKYDFQVTEVSVVKFTKHTVTLESSERRNGWFYIYFPSKATAKNYLKIQLKLARGCFDREKTAIVKSLRKLKG